MRYLQSKKNLIIVGAAGVFVIAVAVVGFWALNNKIISNNDSVVNSSDTCNNDAVGEELKSQFPNFTAADAPDMEQIISRIQQINNHVDSVNCLYILGKYSAFTGFNTKAAEYYNNLLSINEKSGVWIDPTLGNESRENILGIRDFLTEEDTRLRDAILRQNGILPEEKEPSQ